MSNVKTGPCANRNRSSTDYLLTGILQRRYNQPKHLNYIIPEAFRSRGRIFYTLKS